MVLFRRTSRTTWKASFTREKKGGCRGLVRRSLVDAFGRLLQHARVELHGCAFDDWCGVGGFDLADIADPISAGVVELAAVRVLQRSHIGARIQSIRGIRTGAGCPSIDSLLPGFWCRGADEVTVLDENGSATGLGGSVLAKLRVNSKSLGLFSWPEQRQALSGPVIFIAKCGGRVLATRRTVFEKNVLANSYRHSHSQESKCHRASFIVSGVR